LDDPYRMKRRGRGKPYYPPKGMALLAVMMFRMALSEREICELVKNEHVANRTRRIAKYPR